MNNTIPFILATVFCFCVSIHNAFADSPLTSIDFTNAYSDEPIVQEALLADGLLTTSVLQYITDDAKPIGIKLACIRALGFEVNGKDNYSILVDYLRKKNNYPIGNAMLYQLSADTLICMGYVKALDNYFEVSEALSIARLAKSKAATSYAIHLLTAMIEAQQLKRPYWCLVYRLAETVRNYPGLKMDLRPEAIDAAFAYMNLYKKYCD
ncbi:MAG: hypothetical protein ACPH2K_06425 [Flavicella sp.]